MSKQTIYRRCIQMFEDLGQDEESARLYFDFQKEQQGLLTVRLLEPIKQVGRDGWRVQAIFEHNGLTTEENKYLPDGSRECTASFPIIAQYGYVTESGHQYFTESQPLAKTRGAR